MQKYVTKYHFGVINMNMYAVLCNNIAMCLRKQS